MSIMTPMHSLHHCIHTMYDTHILILPYGLDLLASFGRCLDYYSLLRTIFVFALSPTLHVVSASYSCWRYEITELSKLREASTQMGSLILKLCWLQKNIIYNVFRYRFTMLVCDTINLSQMKLKCPHLSLWGPF